MNTALIAPRPKKKISLTPLIDVVFILLMFFMLTSTFNKWKSIELLSGSASEAPVELQPEVVPQLLVLHQDGMLSLKGGSASLEHVDIDTLAPALKLDESMVVFPEALATVQTIVATMERLKAVGAQKMTLGNALQSNNPLKAAAEQVTP